MTSCTTKFIVDTYDKYSKTDRVAARYTFRFHEQDWAIKEYPYVNGELMRPIGIFDREDINESFYLYDSFDDAMKFVMTIKGKVMENE